MQTWPSQSEADTFYGNPRGGNGGASAFWELANLTRVAPPFAMQFAGGPVAQIRVHRKCAESLRRVLGAIWQAAGQSQAVIDAWGVSSFGGSYNFRLMRGSHHLSMHAYGCAIDLAPERFPMGQARKQFCSDVRQAFADEGWVNLPRDRMHFQAARLK